MEKACEKFIVTVEAVVESVVGHTGSVSFTPESEMVFGGRSPVYHGGQFSHLEITIGDHPVVKKILFAGLPPIEEGDRIRAYVFKCEEYKDIFCGQSQLRRAVHNITCLPIEERIPPKYVLRDFKAEEQAFKIEKLRPKVRPEKVNDDASRYQVRATYIDNDISSC